MKPTLCAWFLFLATFVRAQGINEITLSGRVVDDATSMPLVDFTVEQGWTNSFNPGEVSWQVSMSGSAQSQNPGGWSVTLGYSRVAARISSPGYSFEILQMDSFTNRQPSGLVVRLKRGEIIHGTVRDADGKPVVGAKVYLATLKRIDLTDGKFQYGNFRDNSPTTDASGHFELLGAGGPPQKIVVVTADNHLVWPTIKSGQGSDMEITLPKPGSLIVRYDIPGDLPEAKPEIYLITTNKNRTLWKEISFGLSFTVTNGEQFVLTNLTPGSYHLRRCKTDGAHGAETEQQIVVVEAGQTAHSDMVRTNGQRIRGKVLGFNVMFDFSDYIFVKSADATGLPWPQRSRNEQNEFKYRTFDVLQFHADGTFETAMLSPGTYTVIANVYPPGDLSSGMSYRNSNPDYVAVAKVTVTTNAMLPVTLTLAQAQYVDIAGTAVDDATGAPIQDLMIESGKVNPDKLREIIWNTGYQGAFNGGKISFLALKEGTALRFRAKGYVPQVFTRDEIITSRQTANLQVRLQRGAELHGVVLDHIGQPVAHAMVYLCPLDLGFVRLGSLGSFSDSSRTITYWGHTFATTDVGGHFSLRGVDGDQTRIIVVTDDSQMGPLVQPPARAGAVATFLADTAAGRLIQPVQVSLPAQNLKVTLPEPATLIVHYDIPGDVPETDFQLTMHTNELEMPLWKYVTLKPHGRVKNGGQTVMTNLLAGTYDFSLNKYGGAVGHEHSFLYGDPYQSVQFNPQTIVLKPGQTQRVSVVRSAGQRVQGRVRGLGLITNTAGAFLYVASANAISNLNDFKTKSLEPCYDAVFLDTNELFQTALLEPGSYTLLAEVFVRNEFKPHEFADDEPQYGDMAWGNPLKLGYVGSTNITVTNKAAPPVTVELHPWVEPAKSP